MPFEQQTVEARNITLSTNKQNAFGTALADAAMTLRPPIIDPGSFANIKKEWYSNLQRGNKGHQWATVRQEIGRFTDFQMGGDLDEVLAGWLCAFAFMDVTTTGAGVKTHAFKPLVSSNQAPVTTIYFEDTADLKYKMQDLAIAELEISGSDRGPLQFRASMVGSGRHTDGAMAAPVASAVGTLLMGNDTDFLIGPSGAAVSIKEQIRNWSVTFAIGVVPHRAPGGGKFASFMRLQEFRTRFSATISAKNVDNIRTLLLNDTLQEVQINTNSGAAAQLNIKYPNIYLSAAQIGVDGMDQVWQIETDEQAMMKLGASEVVQVSVLNNQATYLVGA
ncbi:MAG TPA: hypothetical protein VN577_19980 [Terriglobales bacterium]|nr:hypothetical protein [Terriglobales bacterium]